MNKISKFDQNIFLKIWHMLTYILKWQYKRVEKCKRDRRTGKTHIMFAVIHHMMLKYMLCGICRFLPSPLRKTTHLSCSEGFSHRFCWLFNITQLRKTVMVSALVNCLRTIMQQPSKMNYLLIHRLAFTLKTIKLKFVIFYLSLTCPFFYHCQTLCMNAFIQMSLH